MGRGLLALLGLAVLHLAAPGTGFLVAVLDQPLEPLEITVYLTLDDAESRTDRAVGYTTALVLKVC